MNTKRISIDQWRQTMVNLMKYINDDKKIAIEEIASILTTKKDNRSKSSLKLINKANKFYYDQDLIYTNWFSPADHGADGNFKEAYEYVAEGRKFNRVIDGFNKPILGIIFNNKVVFFKIEKGSIDEELPFKQQTKPLALPPPPNQQVAESQKTFSKEVKPSVVVDEQDNDDWLEDYLAEDN
jgi:hypothetical protein